MKTNKLELELDLAPYLVIYLVQEKHIKRVTSCLNSIDIYLFVIVLLN